MNLKHQPLIKMVYEDFVILQGVNEKIDENKVKLEELYGDYYEYLESID